MYVNVPIIDNTEFVQIIPRPIKMVANPKNETDNNNKGFLPSLSTIVAETNVTTTFTNDIKQLIIMEWLGKLKPTPKHHRK